MKTLLSALNSIPEYEKTLASLSNGRWPVCINGLASVHKAHFAAALHQSTGRPLVVVCHDELAVQRMAGDLASFLEKAPGTVPVRELALYDAVSVSRGWEQKRLSALYQLSTGSNDVWVISLDCLMQRTLPKDMLLASSFEIRLGDCYDLDELAARLVRAGYKRADQVEGQGQFSIRGGILDFYSPAHENPVRVEFFGDETDSMGLFDTVSQRRIENIDRALILPAAETLPQLHRDGLEGLLADMDSLCSRLAKRKIPNQVLINTIRTDMERLENSGTLPAIDRYMAFIYDRMETAAGYIPDNALVVLCEHGSVESRADALIQETGMDLDSLLQSGSIAGELCDFLCTFDDLLDQLVKHPLVMLDSFLGARYPANLSPKELLSLSAKQLPSYGGSLETAVSDLEHYRHNGFRTIVFCAGQMRAESLRQMLDDRGVPVGLDFALSAMPDEGSVVIAEGSFSAGFEYTSAKLAVLTEGQLISAPSRKAKRKKATNRQKLNSFTDLSPGDLVVHETHGIGRFAGIEKITLDGTVRDYLKIAYAGTDCLYVPATQLDTVSKYIGGGEDAQIRLNKLGGDAWNRTKSRAKAAAKDLAKGLIELYAERQRRPGHAFSPDDVWQREFEDAFEYAETEDQLRSIVDIKKDMEAAIPMDRLLCGDVGFGKTEVALRAVMKCVLDNKQAAILVPTTVLAQQHYVTAVNRFNGFPVKIDVLSRFRTAAQHKATLRQLSAGTLDIIIGTHRLLQKDVVFKDLGLLIVDEEQRFGVTHKERLKELSRTVDVLTLSATPIPRTLNMALSGLRDMSTLEEPPQDRHPVQTYVMEYNEQIIADAIRRELARGGQVYYLHNRVENIQRTAAKISAMADGASVAVAHGKLPESELSDVMQRMAEGEIRILVCTTIIETGIDIPNVNTLIIEDADNLGLAQLHQLRGRVGRSSRHAFAYFTYRQQKVLSEIAMTRLSAISEYAEFGSGFKIAMRDLEIRGAGNLLGPEQSGNIMSVGYDMYLKLLEEAVLEEKGETPVEAASCTVDIIVSANIPDRYIPSGEQRMDIYRRIATIRNEDDADDVVDELVDRYGDIPRSVNALVSIALLRSAAADAGISDISQKSGSLLFTLGNLDFEAVSYICSDKSLKGRVLFSAGEKPYLSLRLVKGEDPLTAATQFVAKYSGYKSPNP